MYQCKLVPCSIIVDKVGRLLFFSVAVVLNNAFSMSPNGVQPQLFVTTNITTNIIGCALRRVSHGHVLTRRTSQRNLRCSSKAERALATRMLVVQHVRLR